MGKAKIVIESSKPKANAPRHPDKIVDDHLAALVAGTSVPMGIALATSDMSQNAKAISVAFVSGIGLRWGSIAYKGFKDFKERRPRYGNGELIPPGIAKSAAGAIVNGVGIAVCVPIGYHLQKSGVVGDFIKEVPTNGKQILAALEVGGMGLSLAFTQGIAQSIRGHSFDRSFC